MNVIYEHKNELAFIGFRTEIAPDEGYKKCPEFWDKEYNEKYAHLWQTMKPETPVEAAILANGIGMYAICADSDDVFAYWIAGLYKGGDVPEGLELFTFPESDWAIFTAKGPLRQTLQMLNTQVWNEWAPNIKTMYEVSSSSLEIYSAMNPQSPDYECGIWVPIRKKADLNICQSCGMPMAV
ncbi:MAG: effector binding domain-containing protein [Clostridia bacterium]|nr:effector binding domain-containing protein [Clostridia bacterium]